MQRLSLCSCEFQTCGSITFHTFTLASLCSGSCCFCVSILNFNDTQPQSIFQMSQQASVFSLSVHSLWLVPNVQRDWEPTGQTAGVWRSPAFAFKSMFCGCECSFHPDICCHLQLLEDVEETLSCAVFEEDYLLRKLNCE